MMKPEEDPLLYCWKQIGVFGDLSCPELPALIHCRNCSRYNRAGRRLFDREIPGEFLDEWTRNFTAVKEAEERDTVSVVVFRIDGEWFALKTVYLQETTHFRQVHYVPYRTNKIFKGLVNINGELLLCVSLADLTETAALEEKASNLVGKRMLVINKQGERYAFPVEEVLGIYRIPLGDLQKPPVTIAKSPLGVVGTVFDLDGRKVGLLGEDKLIHALKGSLGS